MLEKYSEINTPHVIIILFLFYSLRSLNDLRYKKKTNLLLASSGCCDIKISSSIVCPCAYCNVPTFTLNIQNSIINLSISKFSNIDWLNINKINFKIKCFWLPWVWRQEKKALPLYYYYPRYSCGVLTPLAQFLWFKSLYNNRQVSTDSCVSFQDIVTRSLFFTIIVIIFRYIQKCWVHEYTTWSTVLILSVQSLNFCPTFLFQCNTFYDFFKFSNWYLIKRIHRKIRQYLMDRKAPNLPLGTVICRQHLKLKSIFATIGE